MVVTKKHYTTQEIKSGCCKQTSLLLCKKTIACNSRSAYFSSATNSEKSTWQIFFDMTTTKTRQKFSYVVSEANECQWPATKTLPSSPLLALWVAAVTASKSVTHAHVLTDTITIHMHAHVSRSSWLLTKASGFHSVFATSPLVSEALEWILIHEFSISDLMHYLNDYLNESAK